MMVNSKAFSKQAFPRRENRVQRRASCQIQVPFLHKKLRAHTFKFVQHTTSHTYFKLDMWPYIIIEISNVSGTRKSNNRRAFLLRMNTLIRWFFYSRNEYPMAQIQGCFSYQNHSSVALASLARPSVLRPDFDYMDIHGPSGSLIFIHGVSTHSTSAICASSLGVYFYLSKPRGSIRFEGINFLIDVLLISLTSRQIIVFP